VPLSKFSDNSYAHFVTSKTFNNYPYFKDEYCCRILLENIKFYGNKFDYEILAWVIMYDHLHLILWWNVEEKKNLTISKIMQWIKGNSAREIIDYLVLGRRKPLLSPISFEQRLKANHRRGLKYRIWQPGFYDFNIYSDKKLQEKENYIHQNPIRAGLVKSIDEYKWSSFNDS